MCSQVTFVEADICKAYDSKGNPDPSVVRAFDVDGKPVTGKNMLPKMGEVDIVTCSYCLTMIPPWQDALESMVSSVDTGKEGRQRASSLCRVRTKVVDSRRSLCVCFALCGWKQIRTVRVGGTIALVDFTKRTDRPHHWSQSLNRWWFANDGVYFDERQP